LIFVINAGNYVTKYSALESQTWSIDGTSFVPEMWIRVIPVDAPDINHILGIRLNPVEVLPPEKRTSAYRIQPEIPC
jgi:hypothetical protein